MQNSSLYQQERRRAAASGDGGTIDERALVRRAVSHDARAFTRLYDRYVDRIFRYIYYKLGSRADAEDLTAQVFLKAWEAIGHYRVTERPFSAWLYRIAHNLVVDHFRVQRPVLSIDEVALPEARASDLDELALQHLTADTLKRAIARLTPDQRQVILLRFIEGYDTEQVALIMGKGEGAVRTLQHRALASLGRIFRKGSETL
ncbi:MAG: sigma-70 family RNA polymerase sigma factor [Chloroflexi bacterium]|nr:sigma-70 family RNA polymerase sigma factor [Chloroflexota bacterium]